MGQNVYATDMVQHHVCNVLFGVFHETQWVNSSIILYNNVFCKGREHVKIYYNVSAISITYWSDNIILWHIVVDDYYKVTKASIICTYIKIGS